MAFDADAAGRVRAALGAMPGAPVFSEKKMMGALVFMAGDKMCCGVTGDALMLRLGAEGAQAAQGETHVRPMEIGGGRMPRGFVLVDPPGWKADAALAALLRRAMDFVATL